MECSNISLGYDNNVLVSGLSFRIPSHSYVCVLGENGSGKSTLIRTLLGLQNPLQGVIEKGDGLRDNEIGYLPQQTIVQKDFPASVWEVVLSGCQGKCKFRPFYTKEEKQMALESIGRMDIQHLMKRCYRELSGGQQQRVLLARSLCATSKLLILDEPVSGLDPKVTINMYELIESLHKDGIAIIMISHDIHAALQYATHILHLGQKVFFGTVEKYRKSDFLKVFDIEEGGAKKK